MGIPSAQKEKSVGTPKYVKLAEELKLGVGDVSKIELLEIKA
jgi:hypothetical protein